MPEHGRDGRGTKPTSANGCDTAQPVSKSRRGEHKIMNRRSFLKVGAASAAVPLGHSPSISLSGKNVSQFQPAEAPGEPASEREVILPAIPKSATWPAIVWSINTTRSSIRHRHRTKRDFAKPPSLYPGLGPSYFHPSPAAGLRQSPLPAEIFRLAISPPANCI